MADTIFTSPARTGPRITPRAVPSAIDLSRIRMMGVDFAVAREDEVVSLFVDRAVARAGCWVITANLDHLRRYASEPSTRRLIHAADVVVADGMPLVVASRLAGLPLPERVAGSSMVAPIARRAAERGASVFLLGGEPGVADRAAHELCALAPGLDVAGTYCPAHGFEDDPDQLAEINRVLRAANPDIVLVALGFPKQDRLIQALRGVLPGASFVGVGITLSFVAGDVARAPMWMRRAGVEWLHRLVSEPRRLWKRYLVHGLPFAARLGAAALVARAQRSLGGPWEDHVA
jgi:N-acetylglucosaminyldiphosphoundecaprenol N-acetyl-beta-D-mannosaminyltransferase